MSPEQIVALLVAFAGVLSAVGVVIAQVASLRRAVDGRMTEMLELTRQSADATGQLAGRAFATDAPRDPRNAGRRTHVPLDDEPEA